MKRLGQDVVDDLRARAPWYVSDWKEGFESGHRILAPSVYVFFASVIPALAFGEQLDYATKGAFNGTHVLLSTALAGVVQSIFGGQPLLIYGVAGPMVLVYTFMYDFAEGQGFAEVFIPWCTWTQIWCALMLALFAVTGLCQYICKFTRFSGELFGTLIGILFIQQGVVGVIQEFRIQTPCAEAAAEADAAIAADCVTYMPQDRMVNGLWAVILALGTLLTSVLVRTARSWPFFNGAARSFLADYGVPVMVIAWSGLSFAVQGAAAEGIPRRLSMPDAWQAAARQNWDAAARLGDVSGPQIAYALAPAAIIAVLYYFDHNVSSQLAQQKDFQLVRPPAYNWDMVVLAILMAGSGFVGLPAANGATPQAPMHTQSLVTLKKMLVESAGRKRSAASNAKAAAAARGDGGIAAAAPAGATDAGGGAGTGGATPTATGTAAFEGLAVPTAVLAERPESSSSRHSTGSTLAIDDGYEKEYLQLHNGVVPLNVKEQRLSNLLQSLLVGASAIAAPLVRNIPKSVLWGYFVYMAVANLPGTEFWDRTLLLLTGSRKRLQMLQQEHPAYLETVEYKQIVRFTAFQLAYMLAVWGVTWAGTFGVAFPIFIVLLIPIRQYVMPRLFGAWALSQLDAAEYEEAPAAEEWVVRERACEAAMPGEERATFEYDARELVEQQMAGQRGIRHHLSPAEMRRRSTTRRSLNVDASGGSVGSDPALDPITYADGLAGGRRSSAGAHAGGHVARGSIEMPGLAAHARSRSSVPLTASVGDANV